MANTAPTQRDQQVLAIESEGRLGWKRASGYYAQAYAENVFARFKRTSLNFSEFVECKNVRHR